MVSVNAIPPSAGPVLTTALSFLLTVLVDKMSDQTLELVGFVHENFDINLG